jgi:hypothetical protein
VVSGTREDGGQYLAGVGCYQVSPAGASHGSNPPAAVDARVILPRSAIKSANVSY